MQYQKSAQHDNNVGDWLNFVILKFRIAHRVLSPHPDTPELQQ